MFYYKKIEYSNIAINQSIYVKPTGYSHYCFHFIIKYGMNGYHNIITGMIAATAETGATPNVIIEKSGVYTGAECINVFAWTSQIVIQNTSTKYPISFLEFYYI